MPSTWSTSVPARDPGEPGNVEKLNTLVAAANTEGNSHFINVEPGFALLQDVLSNSPILASVPGLDSTRPSPDFGVPGADGMDDDMQIALRISLEEEQQRRALEAQRQNQQPVQPEQLVPLQDAAKE